MMLSDREILARVGMIEPFVDHQVSEGVVSYGLSSYGYDFRVGNHFKVFTSALQRVVDPKDFNSESFVSISVKDGDFVLIPPNSFVLGESVETWRVPRDILVLCLGKSTYARCGLILNVTPFEPEWEGVATLEISNTTPLPARVYAGEGIGQAIFLKTDEVCGVSYADRKGKYQGQTGVTPAMVKGVGVAL